MKKIHILLIGDNKLLCEAIALMLKKKPDLQVVSASGKVDDVLLKIERNKPDILLLNPGEQKPENLQIVQISKEHYPELKFIVMNILPLQEDVYQYVKAGVSGFILKDATIIEFASTLRLVSQGARILPPLLAGPLFSQIIDQAVCEPTSSSNNGDSHADSKSDATPETVYMTKREQEVMVLITDGCSNKEIADNLNLSTFTVKSHVHNILEKLALNSRVQIAKHAHTTDMNKTVRQGF